MKRLFQRIRFQTGLSLLLVFVILGSIFGMAFTSSYVYRRNLSKNVSASRADVLTQISDKVSLIQKCMVSVSSLYQSSIVKYVLSKETVDETDISMLRANINSLELSYKNALNVIDIPFHIVLIGQNGFVFTTGHEEEYEIYDYASLKQKKWFREIPQEDGRGFWTRTHTEIYGGIFYVSYAVSVKTDNGKTGVLMVSVPETELTANYSNNIGEENNIFILNAEGRVVSRQSKGYIGETYPHLSEIESFSDEQNYQVIEQDGREYLLSAYTDPEFGWHYVEEMDMAQIMLPSRELTISILSVAVIMSFIAAVIIWFLVRTTTYPLTRLSAKFEEVSNGHFDTVFNVSGWREISNINRVSGEMTHRIMELIESIKTEEKQKRRAEMATLRMQINPHMMYNTLFSIKCMVAMGENDQAEKMIESFTKLLREVLNNDGKEIPLREELNIVQNYLILLHYRYGGSLKVRYDIAEETENLRVLKMLLQPVIENSVIHGIEPDGGNRTILIRSYTRGEYLMIEISDDGVGMSAGKLQEENRKIRDTEEAPTHGNIGNRNVNQRIVINYGEEYGLFLKSREGGGTTASLILPRII